MATELDGVTTHLNPRRFVEKQLVNVFYIENQCVCFCLRLYVRIRIFYLPRQQNMLKKLLVVNAKKCNIVL